MAKGQACGNETEYISANPPENKFDPVFYRKTYPDLNLQSDSAAVKEWETTGKVQGRMPNAMILKHMTNLGKAGYVDLDAVLHRLPNTMESVGYKTFEKWSNVTGTKMEDCSVGSYVKYGDRVVLACNDTTGYLTTDSVMKFGSKKAVMILRPPPNTSLTNAPLTFGDHVSMALSMTNYTSTCGYWGCKVGNVDRESLTYIFGPGGETGGTLMKVGIPSSTTAFKIGDKVPYDAPFTLTVSNVATNNAMFQGDKLLPGSNRINSTNEQYYLTYQNDGIIALFKQPDTLLWKSDKGDANPNRVVVSDAGRLEAINASGVTYWSSNTTGSSPVALAVQNDGRIVLYDGALREIWARGLTSTAQTFAETVGTLSATLQGDTLYFDSSSKVKTVFSFQTKDGLSPTEKCDADALQSACGTDCVGFLHDTESNEWQPIKVASKESDFKISGITPDIHLKVPTISLQDTSCAKGVPNYVDASLYSAYVVGSDLSSTGTKQCYVKNQSLDMAEDALDKIRLKELADAAKSAKEYDESSINEMWSAFDDRHDDVYAKSDELKAALTTLKNKPKKNVTLEKVKQDSEVIQRLYKSRSFVWLVVAIVVVVAALMMWFGFGKMVVYGFTTLVVLYFLFYLSQR
jgi:hypothetical protein